MVQKPESLPPADAGSRCWGRHFSDEEIREARESRRLLTLELETSRVCNLQCIYCYSEAGRRPANEDSLLVDQSVGLYVVCDGAGGKLGGRVASQMVCRALHQHAAYFSNQVGRQIDDRAQAAVDELIRMVHQQIAETQQASAELSDMATTVAMAVHRGCDLLLSHVCDSRIYLFRDSELHQLTRDHSLENFAKDNPGFRRQAHHSPKALVRAVGMKRAQVVPDHSRLELQQNDLTLICSDGLSDSVPPWVLREILLGIDCLSLDDLADGLVRSALSHGSMDNVSVVLLHASDRNETSAAPPTAIFEMSARNTTEPTLAAGWLVVTQGPKKGQIVPVEGSTVLGADPSCRIVLTDGYVSARHSEVLRTQHGFLLRDLGSTNGTYINNIKLAPEEEVSLVDGDLIRAGTTEMMFKCHEFE